MFGYVQSCLFKLFITSLQSHVGRIHEAVRIHQCDCEIEGKFFPFFVGYCYQKELSPDVWGCMAVPATNDESDIDRGM